MVTQETVKQIREEYRAYLTDKHPNWAENTVSTHLSDAFYLWNNDIIPPFWQCLASEEGMEQARQTLLSYFTDEVVSNNPQSRSADYYADLVLLKEFFDTQYGGVQARIGVEYRVEEDLYLYCRRAYEGTITTGEAVQALRQVLPAYGETSFKMILILFAAMMEGKRYTRRVNTELTLHFIRQIGAEFGREHLINALTAVWENILYYYEQTGNKSSGLCRGCRAITEGQGVDIAFDETMFENIIPKQMPDPALTDPAEKVRYWLYAAGDSSEYWPTDYQEGVMAIGWEDLGDLSQYSSKAEIRSKLQALNGNTSSYKHQVHAVWQFVNEIKPGDIVFVKRGVGKIIGRGVVEGDYVYDPDRLPYHNLRKVRWTNRGEWPPPGGRTAMKTLTEITAYTEYLENLQALFEDGESSHGTEQPILPETPFEDYTRADFLSEVYLEEGAYDTLKTLLLTKKNLILQGAPGVGKTFAAKRLAYAILGKKDASRVKMVQFHQSYSYEDFMMGFRPAETGFTLKTGVFYDFCKQAEEDDRPYFFIIDEINRGNLSKIFGELFMLLERDKRGVSLQLLYADEQFSIPGNVYLIGMMNTADRSLAMLDYALRRRFSFYPLAPAFQSTGFKAYQSKLHNEKFDRLIRCVEELNQAIAGDDALGEGFCIGHSYFCTQATVNDGWLKSVVEFELIPLLKEYWFDEPAKVRGWSSRLRSVL